MSNWTPDSVLALAPDPGSAKSGRDLSAPRKWLSVGRNPNTTALWGECQGSGKLPYQTQIDLSSTPPTFKCSCPSRKFPCKHGLGLLLMYAGSAASVAEASPPSWVTDWLEGRSKRAEAKAAKAAEPPKPVDEAAKAKREASREKKVQAGVAELSLWLRDLVRGGLAQAPNKPYKFWEDMGARLVDAQAPGLARRVRELSDHTSGPEWQDRLLTQLGSIHLLCQGYSRLENLSPEQQADIRTGIGFSQPQEEVQALEGVGGTWLVMGQAQASEDKLKTRRTWLNLEGTPRYALILEFAFGNQGFSAPLSSDVAWAGELAFFPSTYPMRAMLKNGAIAPDNYSLSTIGPSSAEAMLESYAKALAANPWLPRIPITLSATLEPFGPKERWTLRSGAHQIRLHPAFSFHHGLLGNSGGYPLHFFGEWDGQSFLPLRAYGEGDQTLHTFPHSEGQS